MLCCIGCAIFGISEVPTEGINFDIGDFAYMNAEAGTAPSPGTAAPSNGKSPNQAVYVPPPPQPEPSLTPASEVPVPGTIPTPSITVSEPVDIDEATNDIPSNRIVEVATDIQAQGLPAGEIDELD